MINGVTLQHEAIGSIAIPMGIGVWGNGAFRASRFYSELRLQNYAFIL